jgi:hypothetical protein
MTYTPSNISSIDRAALMARENSLTRTKVKTKKTGRNIIDAYSAGSSDQNFLSFVWWGSSSSSSYGIAKSQAKAFL